MSRSGKDPGRRRHHKDHRVDLFVDKLKNLKKDTNLVFFQFKVSNSDAKDSICNRAGLQAVFASAAVLLHSEHSL